MTGKTATPVLVRRMKKAFDARKRMAVIFHASIGGGGFVPFFIVADSLIEGRMPLAMILERSDPITKYDDYAPAEPYILELEKTWGHLEIVK